MAPSPGRVSTSTSRASAERSRRPTAESAWCGAGSRRYRLDGWRGSSLFCRASAEGRHLLAPRVVHDDATALQCASLHVMPLRTCPAYRCGLQTGDIVVMVNGTHVLGLEMEKFVALLKAVRARGVAKAPTAIVRLARAVPPAAHWTREGGRAVPARGSESRGSHRRERPSCLVALVWCGTHTRSVFAIGRTSPSPSSGPTPHSARRSWSATAPRTLPAPPAATTTTTTTWTVLCASRRCMHA